jgi:hypothetical protein
MLTVTPIELITDAAAISLGVLGELIPSAWHHVEQYANSPDRGRPRSTQKTDYEPCADYPATEPRR